ncbi:MAG: ATP-binding protein [Spirulinaceae cyanobacterium]
MNITEFLQFADELIFAKTGKHLSNLQKTVLQGVWRNMNYEAIAKTVHRDEQYLRNVGSDLWKILTEALGEKINKANAISVIEREIVIKSNQDTTNFVGIGNLNLFSSCDSHQNQQEHESRQQVHQDWNSFDCGNPDFATKVSRFYGRDQEIDTLENWIFNCFNRLISVVGITGIGKTLLARKLIELHAYNFEKICWRSLQLKPSIDSILDDLLQSFSIKVSVSESLDSKLSQFIEVLKKQRCLIVFDDVHYLFKK